MKRILKFFREDVKVENKFEGVLLSEIMEEFDNKTEVRLRITRKEVVLEFNVKIEGNNKITNEIIVLHPMDGRNKFKILSEDVIEIMAQDETGMRYWECKKVKDYEVSGIDLLKLTQIKSVKKVNRRGAYRVQMDKQVEYTYDEGKGKGEIKDMSLTGIKLKTYRDHEIGEYISFILADVGLVTLCIVREIEEDRTNIKRAYGAKYVDNDKRGLEKFICDVQIEKIKKNRYR